MHRGGIRAKVNRVSIPVANPGVPTQFTTTRWTVVLQAAGAESGPNEALEQLCRVYWPPLYAFLRRRGYSSHEAEDVVQGFFERFLAKDYLRDVSPEKGRFRSFLLASLRHFAANVRRDRQTERRGGGVPHLDLDNPEIAARCEAALEADCRPEVVFDRVWAETIMDRAARQLRRDQVESGKAGVYEVIRVWLATEPRPGAYAAAATKLGMTEGAIATAVYRLRQRFRELVRAEVAHTVLSPTDVESELTYLLDVLSAV